MVDPGGRHERANYRSLRFKTATRLVNNTQTQYTEIIVDIVLQLLF
jgi:hypothetical protein